jgi:UDP-glucuronate 4-epimerase
MKKILITGVAGFIGSHLYKLLSSKYELIGIDNLSAFSNYDIKIQRLKNIFGNNAKDNKFQQIDICDKLALEKLFLENNFDAVIHLAAMTGVRQSIHNPEIYEQTNVNGFLNILEACRKFNVKQLIYASSSSVYGGNKEIPFKETAPIENLLNYYAITKRMNELAAENYANLYDINAVGLRFFTVYGPWTRPDMATYTFIKNISEGKAITLFDAGNLQRDFTYVDDITTAIELILNKMFLNENQQKHQLFNIGGGQPILVKEYVALISSLMNKKAIIVNAPMNNEEMKITYADATKLYDFINFRPTISSLDGLKKTVDWYINDILKSCKLIDT